jgi:hypothetical protein
LKSFSGFFSRYVSVSPLKFVKSAKDKKKLLQKFNLSIKNAEFDADFEFIVKVTKNARKKSYQ